MRDSDQDKPEGYRHSHTRDTNERAIIGPSISIKGEVTGSGDILVLGSVEGTINLKENEVTVGKGARINADILANVIHVEGEVTGDLKGREQVVVHQSGQVRGNITSPRLSLEDGARLKGSIDTEAPAMESALPVIEKAKQSSKNGDGSAKAAAAAVAPSTSSVQ